MIVKYYEAKPVTIQAMHVPDHASKKCAAEWIAGHGGYSYFRDGHMYIQTLEGDMRVSEDDYIIRGLVGEFYPVKPSIFHTKYELV